MWDRNFDIFYFNMKKLSILKIASSLYDPFGVMQPIMISFNSFMAEVPIIQKPVH